MVLETLSTFMFNLLVRGLEPVPLKYVPVPASVVAPVYYTFIVPVDVSEFSA